ncbi:hypothetical protein GIH37_06060 [Lactobacillus rhamnosus]|nr:hypothetical protein [Lacticaseibacillus rhamnosus]
MSVIDVVTAITACVCSLVVLVIGVTQLIKATTKLLHAVNELMQASNYFEKNRQTKSRNSFAGMPRLLVA